MADRKSVQREERLDDGSFEQVFREFFTPLMKFSLKILENEDDAREVVHQVFVNLWERREETDLSRSLKSYLFTAVHNRSLNVIRDRKKFSDEEVPEQSGPWDVSEQIEAMELEQRIMEALEELPDKCRQVFEMNRFQGLKYQEVASQLNISVKTVENQMSKALKMLREKLMKFLVLLLWLLTGTLN
jgi:RNA polymerase sigma-70 factor (ECF subfamily)